MVAMKKCVRPSLCYSYFFSARIYFIQITNSYKLKQRNEFNKEIDNFNVKSEYLFVDGLHSI